MNIFRFFNRKNISIDKVSWFWDNEKDICTILTGIQSYKMKDILVIWDGILGDKSDQFLSKTQIVNNIWFKTTSKVMISSDMIILSENNDKIMSHLTQSLSQYYQQYQVLIIRSSGQGDATGVGVYESVLTNNNPTSIKQAIKKVYDSNSSEVAIAYREKIWIHTSEIWICIEPCIGNTHYNQYIWPELSWRAKTNKDWSIDLWIQVWIGWWVSDRTYYKINSDTIEWDNLWEKILRERYNESNNKHSILSQCYKSQTIPSPMYNMSIEKVNTIIFDEILKTNIYDYNVSKLIKTVKKLNKVLKQPQYIERAAVHKKNNSFDNYITQIADNSISNELIDLLQPWTLLMDINPCIRSGIKDFDKILYLEASDSFSLWETYKEYLKKYNNENKDYLLIIDSHFTFWWQNKLPFNFFSNAWWIIENTYMDHQWSAESHYEWLLDKTWIMFGTIEYLPKEMNQLDCSNIWEFWFVNFYEFNANSNIRRAQDLKRSASKLFLLP